MRDPNFIRPIRSPRPTTVSFTYAAHDAPRQDADDLPEDDRPAVVVDPDFVQLVVVRALVERRQETARTVLDASHASRRPATG